MHQFENQLLLEIISGMSDKFFTCPNSGPNSQKNAWAHSPCPLTSVRSVQLIEVLLEKKSVLNELGTKVSYLKYRNIKLRFQLDYSSTFLSVPDFDFPPLGGALIPFHPRLRRASK